VNNVSLIVTVLSAPWLTLLPLVVINVVVEKSLKTRGVKRRPLMAGPA
jgi:hypothetical protein